MSVILEEMVAGTIYGTAHLGDMGSLRRRNSMKYEPSQTNGIL